MKLPQPANDQFDTGDDDHWAGCACGCFAFVLLWREGYYYVLCAQCQRDHTMTTIWGTG